MKAKTQSWFMVQTGRGLYFSKRSPFDADRPENGDRLRISEARRVCRKLREGFRAVGDDVRRFPRIVKATLEVRTIMV